MIVQLQGVLSHKGNGFAVFMTDGIGYKVFMLQSALKTLSLGKNAMLWTHLSVREDRQELYGFLAQKELDFFEILIGISGIGPKSALAILNLASVEELERAIGRGDAAYLTKVSGIGKKTAAKIIFELKDTLAVSGNVEAIHDHEDVLEALSSLGYSNSQARKALSKIGNVDLSTSEKIKKALHILSS